MPKLTLKPSTPVEIATAFFKAQEALTALPLDAPDADADALFDILQNFDVLQEKTAPRTLGDSAAAVLQWRASTRDNADLADSSIHAIVLHALLAAPPELRELFRRMELRDVLSELGVRRGQSVAMSTTRMRREAEKLRRSPRRPVSRRRRWGLREVQTISIGPVHPGTAAV